MTDFKKLTLDELCDKLCEKKKTIIVYHVRSDADAVGSAFALKEIFKLLGVPAVCLCSDEVPVRLRFLSEDTQGTVVPKDGAELGHERAISVDSASPAQLGELFNMLRRDIDIMIDHHGTGTVYADNYIDPRASATGEIIYTIAKKLVERGDLLHITPKIVNCVYAAISSDTGGFRFANVTPTTHRMAAELLEAGADSVDINHRLFESKTLKQMSAEGEAARRLRLFGEGRIASVTMPYSSMQYLGLNEEALETVIDIPRCVGGAMVAVSVRQPKPEGVFRVSMRSMSDVDVAAICSKFGGGGHVRAAGCTVEAADVDEAENIIAAAIMKNL